MNSLGNIRPLQNHPEFGNPLQKASMTHKDQGQGGESLQN
jgi:hypothetical protein